MNSANPPRGGLFKTVVQGINSIDTLHDQRKWDQLAETAEAVGACRGLVRVDTEQGKAVHVPCDGVLFALPTPDYQQPTDQIWWQEVQCNVCRAIMASPNRRKLVRSSAHAEMPTGYWQDRMRRLKPTEDPNK